MRKVLLGVMMIGALGACAKLGLPTTPKMPESALQAAAAPAQTAPALTAPLPKPAAKTVEAFDTTTKEQRAAAAAKPAAAAETRMGTTIASLGDPTDPGFWIKTPLVAAPAQGRVEDPATGKSVQVELIPSGGDAGGGSQMSLPAMRLLGVSLTDLPEVTVFKS